MAVNEVTIFLVSASAKVMLTNQHKVIVMVLAYAKKGTLLYIIVRLNVKRKCFLFLVSYFYCMMIETVLHH
jgi:hypothetical protein